MPTFTYLKRWVLSENYIGKTWDNWYSAGVSQNRDSNALDRVNFRTMLRALRNVSSDVKTVCENHWAVGWVEWIAIHQTDFKALETADKLMARLAEYPVLDEDALSQEESEEANQVWAKCYNVSQRIEYIKKNRNQFEFHSLEDMLGSVRGKYFGGYPGELIT